MKKEKDNFSEESFYVPAEDGWRMKMTLFFRERKKLFKIVTILLLLALLAGVYFWQQKQNSKKVAPQADVAVQIPKDVNTNTFANDVSGVSPAIDNSPGAPQAALQDQSAVSKSEKYQIREISFGNSAQLLTSETEGMMLEISDVRSEMLSSKDGSQSNLLIRWKTNKMAISDINYENNGISKKLSEGGYGYAHALVLSDLEQSKRYTFSIKVTDRWNSQKQSENFSVYTGKKNASVFDLITQQFNQIFSWAIKK